MATNFPGSLDNSTSLPYPTAVSPRNGPSLAGLQDNQNDAVIAAQTKLGTGASTPTNNNFLVGTGVGTSAWNKTVPAGTVVGTSDSQTLTNKTLTSPTINSPVITNATISADSITGFSVSNTGTIYGVAVSTGVIQTANTVDGAALKAGTVPAAAIVSSSLTSTQLASNAVITATITDGAVTPAKLVAGAGTSWPWQTYTPTWTAVTVNPAIGNGTITGKYVQIGKTVTAKIEIVAGTTTTFGTGVYSFSLPIASKSERFNGVGAALRTGVAFFASIAANTDVNYTVTTTKAIILQSGGAVGSTTSAWASTDVFTLEITYEII